FPSAWPGGFLRAASSSRIRWSRRTIWDRRRRPSRTSRSAAAIRSTSPSRLRRARSSARSSRRSSMRIRTPAASIRHRIRRSRSRIRSRRRRRTSGACAAALSARRRGASLLPVVPVSPAPGAWRRRTPHAQLRAAIASLRRRLSHQPARLGLTGFEAGALRVTGNGNTSGLAGVVAGRTAICTVGAEGESLKYRGYDVGDLAEHGSFEEVAYLLLYGELPTEGALERYRMRLAALRELPAPVRALLEAMPPTSHPMDVL